MILRCFIATLLSFGMLNAQVVPTKDSIKLLQKPITSFELPTIGASMPINDFGRKDKSSTSGFAIPGLKMDVAFNIQLYKHLGIKSMVMWQNNQLDETKYKKAFYYFLIALIVILASVPWPFRDEAIRRGLMP